MKNEANRTFTENGAVTISTTQSDCLDMFALGGALRDADVNRVESIFMKAYAENPDNALKILFYLRDVLEAIKEMLLKDQKALEEENEVSILGKWLPSINASDKAVVKTAKTIATYMGMNCAQYRKLISALRSKIKIIENNLRTKDYSFDYEKQTSKALFKYRKAFLQRNIV